MLKLGKLIAIAITTLYLSGCAQLMTAEQAAPAINTPKGMESITIAVLDKREYVVNGDKAPSFEGLSRSSFGIPYSQYTPGSQPMTSYLGDRLVAGFNKQGIKAEFYSTTPSMSIERVKEALAKKDKPSIIIALNEWKYDYHAFSDSSWYNVDVLVLDRNAKLKVEKNFRGENDVGNGVISNEMQTIYKHRFEHIFLDSDIENALTP